MVVINLVPIFSFSCFIDVTPYSMLYYLYYSYTLQNVLLMENLQHRPSCT